MLNRISFCAAAVLAMGLSSFSTSANAASLGLNATGSTDDVTSQFITTSYNATTGLFSVSGTTDMLNHSGTGFTNGSFTLKVFIDAGGVIDPTQLALGNDQLIVKGQTTATTNLYTSTSFEKFGFSGTPSNPLFEFVFGPGTGTYGSLGSIGVKLNGPVTSGFNGAFNQNFNNADMTSATDTFTVPLPTSAMMGLSTLALLPLLAKRRKLA